MDWNRVQGSWKQLEGKMKTKWGKLTDNDLMAIKGSREQLEGKLQQLYVYRRTKFIRRLMPGFPRKASSDPLNHVTLKNHSGPKTSLLGPLLFGSWRRCPNSEPAASLHHGTLSRFKAAIM